MFCTRKRQSNVFILLIHLLVYYFFLKHYVNGWYPTCAQTVLVYINTPLLTAKRCRPRRARLCCPCCRNHSTNNKEKAIFHCSPAPFNANQTLLHRAAAPRTTPASLHPVKAESLAHVHHPCRVTVVSFSPGAC